MVKCIDCLHWNGDKNGYWCVLDDQTHNDLTEREKKIVSEMKLLKRKIPDECNPKIHGIEKEHNCPYFEEEPTKSN